MRTRIIIGLTALCGATVAIAQNAPTQGHSNHGATVVPAPTPTPTESPTPGPGPLPSPLPSPTGEPSPQPAPPGR